VETYAWIGVLFCLSQSGIFSGLNLALFGLPKVRLQVDSDAGNRDARRILELRRDSNRLLATILWGNVAVNCLLTILLDSLFIGAVAFLVSTFGITMFGEIGPQAYFSRNAMKVGARLAPLMRIYLFLLAPLAKPTGWVLDAWLGPEVERWFGESDLHHLIRRHVEAPGVNIGRVEGAGAMNFLTIDDQPIAAEAEPLDPESVVELPGDGSRGITWPKFTSSSDDPFLRRIHRSEHKWVVVTDHDGKPRRLLDADGFLRSALLETTPTDPERFSHQPIVVYDPAAPMEAVVEALHARAAGNDVIDQDVVLVWGTEKRILTGADLLGSLLRGVSYAEPLPGSEPPADSDD
jgi:metal transporter CNNM